MSKFRDMLETRIKEEALERGDNFIHMRNGDPHETGIQRGPRQHHRGEPGFGQRFD